MFKTSIELKNPSLSIGIGEIIEIENLIIDTKSKKLFESIGFPNGKNDPLWKTLLKIRKGHIRETRREEYYRKRALER